MGGGEEIMVGTFWRVTEQFSYGQSTFGCQHLESLRVSLLFQACHPFVQDPACLGLVESASGKLFPLGPDGLRALPGDVFQGAIFGVLKVY